MAKNTATPVITHRQKLLGLFPDWRLKNTVKNASDEELEASADACEWWGWRGAMLLMIGLIAEIVLAWWDPPHESIPGRWGNVFATLLVAIGVGFEVQFARMGHRRSNELDRRTKDKLGEAIERAAEAGKAAAEATKQALESQLALEKFKAPRSVDSDIFVKEVEGKSSWPVVELLYVDAGDCLSLAGSIAIALGNARWPVAWARPLQRANPSSEFPAEIVPITTSYGAQTIGVTVVARELYLNFPDGKSPQGTLVWALGKALSSQNANGGRDPSMRDGTLRIVVAPKQ
jgi:4-amino-4-deoxy-L-arabinose transferase-like glycosyltransferase